MKQDEYTKEEKVASLLGCGMMMHILEWILIIILLVSCSGPSKIQTVKEREMKASLWHRGNLDPEISEIVKRYGLNQER